MQQIPMVFSSTILTVSSGSITYRSGVQYTSFSSISKYLVAFSQQTWTADDMTMLGRSHGLPSAMRRFFQRFFMASTASMMASEEPTHDVPTAPTVSPASTGALKSRPIMDTDRFWMSADCGYSS